MKLKMAHSQRRLTIKVDLNTVKNKKKRISKKKAIVA